MASQMTAGNRKRGSPIVGFRHNARMPSAPVVIDNSWNVEKHGIIRPFNFFFFKRSYILTLFLGLFPQFM